LISGQLREHAWRLISTRGADKTPTSGLIGLLFALYACDSITTFGFGPYKGTRRANSQVSSFRYYPSYDERPFAYGHKWSAEDAIHELFAARGLLSRAYDAG
jgi:hypothetical protein